MVDINGSIADVSGTAVGVAAVDEGMPTMGRCTVDADLTSETSEL